jgi:hypothetical protein
MKRAPFFLLTLAAGLLTFGRVTAAETALSEGTVIRVTGQAKILLPGRTEAVDLTADMKVPQGATITTGAGEVYLQAHTGTVATIQANSTVNLEQLSVTSEGGTVKQENTLLALKSGNLISNIDPTKRAVNNYGVRTPKGVAAARGTSFSVSVSAGGFNIAATADAVTFTTSTGAAYTISAGMISITLPGGATQPAIPLAQAAASNPAIAQVVADAVTAISTVIQTGNISAAGAANVASQVVSVASTVSPSTAGSSAAQVSTAVSTSTSATITDSATSTTASIASAAATAAPGQAASIAQQVVAASSSTNTQAAATVAAAVAQAVPSQATQVAAAVAQTVAAASPGSSVQVAATVAAAVAKATNTSTATVAAATAAATNTNATAVTNVANNASTQAAATTATTTATKAANTATQATQNITTPPAPPPPQTPPPTTTPQPIDPSTVSRSG